jgi:tetratricopeptide (TPR) repeat protein
MVAPVSQSVAPGVREFTSFTEPALLLSMLGVVVLATIVCRFRRTPWLSFGLAWFLLILAPSSLVPLPEPMAEHRVYLASCGLFLAAGGGFGWLYERVSWTAYHRTALFAFGGVLLLLAMLTLSRNTVWADRITLWRDAADKAPDHWRAHFSLGSALGESGDCRAAIPAFEKAAALEANAHVLMNLATCLAMEGRATDAARAYRRAIDVQPAYLPARVNLALLELQSGHREDAHRHFLQAVSPHPANAGWHGLVIELHEASFHEPARTLELCQEIRRVAPMTSGVDECIRRNEQR